jgi:hypothetical protein
MSIDSEIGGPSAEDRQLVYARMGMQAQAVDALTLEASSGLFSQSALTDPLLLASTTDVDT